MTQEHPEGLMFPNPDEGDQVIPPLSGGLYQEEQEAKVETEAGILSQGAVPLHPAVVRPIFRFEGQVLAEWTGYDGWEYGQEDLNDLAEAAAQMGIMAPAWAQFMLLVVGLHGVRFTAYRAWKRSGRASSKRIVGAVEPPEGR